ncbi:hypothetical protein EQG49_00280 [Periweissella cryptocerci]|uniref:Uncharacterized protein n=1 Tax=Periweissella cryptocerci TaxID=2506420 RepID=A0A4P6YQW4_9LACO|nr:hypothetical protein [Periweissella cryptocerci]QBO34991.1 hypothetical protein EQG49_00280 [Periweissella cryptocerci]
MGKIDNLLKRNEKKAQEAAELKAKAEAAAKEKNEVDLEIWAEIGKLTARYLETSDQAETFQMLTDKINAEHSPVGEHHG